ncbi:conserved hypothetical protein [uncultured Desulfovibrio sp.]|uniref:DUF7680 domain-containing protein n=1 Tax=uncultured Desulfovibrio sp. TaxID=167968 RepID=A0A212KEC9_9BACT|nr:hypothetical protein [uncultured Desulfovibrio sp.]SBW09992.1 conserved hypothetical protein [uncultured Desulfovibrio sp.]
MSAAITIKTELSSALKPVYELKARNHGPDDLELEIWQIPCAATPHIAKPLRIAGLRGRNMALVETQILRRLKRIGISVAPLGDMVQHFALDEEMALNLGLLCRVLAPMRSAERMRAIAQHIENMDREEAAYWLGMAMHRKYPRRVLCALRLLLTDPR